MKVLLGVEESAGAQTVRRVVDRGHDVVGVLTSGEGGRSGPGSVAGHHGLTVLDPARVKDPAFASWIVGQGVDVFLNVHLLHIVHADVLDAPRIGSFNLHPGPLPAYAGLNAPSWAIYEGEVEHGVTLHWMTGRVDAGAVAYEARFPIGPEDTGLKVATTCARLGLPLVDQVLAAAADDPPSVPSVPQKGPGRWFGRAAPHGGRLPWRLTARRIVDLVRASSYAPFPSPWGWPRTRLDGHDLEVVRVAATGEPTTAPPGTVRALPGDAAAGPASSDGGVLVAAGDEWVALVKVRDGDAAVDAATVVRSGQQFEAGPDPT